MTTATLAHRVAVPDEVAAAVRRLADGDARAAQLARFAMTGGLATSVQVLLFTLLAPVGPLAANVVSWAVSTALANELHRRRTFHAGGRVGPITAQLEGGGLSVLGLLVTTLALAAFAVAVPAAGTGLQTLLVVSLTVAVGLVRFVALRWSFGARRTQLA